LRGGEDGMDAIVKCFSCGRRKEKDGIGKVIDGAWVDDWRLYRTEAWGKWVCCLGCYWEVVNKYGWEYVASCDEIGV
jgi:hypothetical protein